MSEAPAWTAVASKASMSIPRIVGRKRGALEPHGGDADKPRMRSVLIMTLAVVVAAAVTGWLDGATPPTDAALFAKAGTTMLSGTWQHTYGDPVVQSGPFELGLVAAASHAGRTQRGFAIVLDVVGALALMLVAVSFLGRRARPLALF